MNEKNNQNILIPKKEENKNVHYKKLNFNPISYFSKKYTQDINKFIKKKNIYENITNNNRNEKEIMNYNFLTRKKYKLKPLNMNRSNFNIKINYKIDDILIPSNKTTKELIEYNKANMHNTILNFYNKNNRNLKIINFVKTNSFERKPNFDLSKKLLNSSKESINNNYSISSNIPNINNKKENLESALKNNTQMEKTSSELGLKKLERNRKKRKSAIDIYESEILTHKQIQRNLYYFHDAFFDKTNKNDSYKYNLLLKSENQLQSNKIDLPENLNLQNIHNKRIFGSLLKNKTRNKRMLKGNKMYLSVKDLKALSLQGYKRMKADKTRQFEFKLKKTNDEVLKLEHKLNELLEKNKQLFLKAESGFD